MIFTETELRGAFLVEPERLEDERGFFARTWCRSEFEERGLDAGLAQCNISYNRKRGTLRGMHYQHPPYAETKLVRCTRGAVYDVILDLRPGSNTFGRWVAAELSERNRRMLYIPRGFAHGFQTLEDGTEVAYQVSEFYHPEVAGCVRWDDPAFRINWPLEVTVIAPRDRDAPDFSAPESGAQEGAA